MRARQSSIFVASVPCSPWFRSITNSNIPCRMAKQHLRIWQESFHSITADASCSRTRAAVGSANILKRFSSSPASCRLKASAVLLKANTQEACESVGELPCELGSPGHGGTATKSSGAHPASSSAAPVQRGSIRCGHRPRPRGGTGGMSLRKPASREAAWADAEDAEFSEKSETFSSRTQLGSSQSARPKWLYA